MAINLRFLKTLSVGLVLAIAGSASATIDTSSVPSILEVTPRHRQVANLVTRFVERQHYSRTRVNDALSEKILDNYIEALDSNKHYFLKPDIEYFAHYDHQLDDVLRTGNLDPVFDIFRLYRLRAQQHLGYSLKVLEHEPDFGIDEYYAFDREDLPWIADEDSMRDVWRRRVKNDALNLMLADKSWEEAREVLRKRYQRLLRRINQLDSDDVFETFMNAFARTLDPHSSYLSPQQSEEYRIQMSLSYQGIGASLRLDEDLVQVLNVIPGGPAAIDGRLQPEDRIIAVGEGKDGEMVDVVGWQLDDVVQLIRGPSGTNVRLQILPAHELPGSGEYIVELVRDKIKLEEQAAKSEVLKLDRDGREIHIGVIKVPSFYQDFEARSQGDEDYVSTTRDVRRLIGELKKENIEGLVLDLRGNGGGHLSEATGLTGLFIDNGPVVQYKNSTGHIEILEDPIPAVAYDGPLVILVDRFSASASEIFTAAMQDYRRGVVIGQQTYGKGTVQNLYLLDQYTRYPADPGLGQLTLTIGKYYRVTGDSTQNRGVLPDIGLPSPVDPERIGESSRKQTLPWDQIQSIEFKANDPLDAAITLLARNESRRLQHDPDVRYLVEDIEAMDDIRARHTISLNMETRKREREQRRQARLERENERRIARGEQPLESLDALDEVEQTDVLLHQAAEVAGDLAMIENLDQSLLSKAEAVEQPNPAGEL